MDWLKIFFPILDYFRDGDELDTTQVISQNNRELAEELKDKGPMTAQQIIEYVKDKKI